MNPVSYLSETYLNHPFLKIGPGPMLDSEVKSILFYIPRVD